jgi:hypothetical protein
MTHPLQPLSRKASAAALVALLLSATTPGGAASEDQKAELRTVLQGNAWLALQVELATPEGFYLVLDAGRKVLRLMYRGTLLREIPVLHIEVGRPRVLFIAGARVRLAPAIRTGARLDPPSSWQRPVITPPPPGETVEQESIPPTPEEAFPAPPRYRIDYDGGFSVEIVSAGAPARRLRERLAGALAALGLADRDAVRLRLTLDAAEAGAVYRSLPPDTRLLVVPGSIAGA